MTKERLEELIKQKATICIMWHPSSPNETLQIKLDSKKYKIDYPYLKRNGKILCLFKQLYELKEIELIIEQAEWHLKTYTERMERFEPPMWEEIKNTYGFRFIYYDDIIEFTVNYSTMLDDVEFNTQKIVIRNLDERELLFVEKATKKNYEKACGIVRDLFRGEK